eukprot:g4574.t1
MPRNDEPLLGGNAAARYQEFTEPTTARGRAYQFVEAKTKAGSVYEAFTMTLIVLNVLGFVVGTQFDATYVPNAPKCSWCDVWFIGDNSFPAKSSILELFTVAVFTFDYFFRFWAMQEEEQFQGMKGHFNYIVSFFSIVDLVSIVPFYIDWLDTSDDLPASQFLRMFRLFRMMRVEGRYLEAFTLFDDVIVNNKHVLGVAGFVGFATWIIVAALYYVAERENKLMIYCPEACDTFVAENCKFDDFGRVVAKTCGPTCEKDQCYNLFQSILSSMYFTLVNLFGEFPLADNHRGWGRVVASFTAVIAVAVFAIPTGIIGNGFDELLSERREERKKEEARSKFQNAQRLLGAASAFGGGMRSVNSMSIAPKEGKPRGERETTGENTFRGRLFNLLHAKNYAGVVFEYFIFFLIFLNVLGFMLETVDSVENSSGAKSAFAAFETFSVIVFTIEYLLRMYAIGEVEMYSKKGEFNGRVSYFFSFYAMVDFISIAPWYVSRSVSFGKKGTTFVRSLRLLRMFKAEQYVEAFTVLDDVIRQQSDVLVVTGFTAMVFWIFFSTVMYYAERDKRVQKDPEMRAYYYSIPDAMWMTLLNLSGESPLCHYTTWGKITTGIIGIFGCGLFGIPIGILGAGFEDWVAEKEENDDGEGGDKDGDNDTMRINMDMDEEGGPRRRSFRNQVYRLVEAKSEMGKYFEGFIFFLIFASIVTTSIQSVEELGCSQTSGGSSATLCEFMDSFEIVAVIIFTAEYLMRLYSLPEDPEYDGYRSGASKVFGYIFSFYSVIDLLAIVPFYIKYAVPSMDQYDNTLRLFRILRLFKLDKYVPSISLLDDVVRAKKEPLIVTGFCAFVLTVIMSALLYMIESEDTENAINPIPYDGGCTENCTQADRFSNAFEAVPIAVIHLSGDFPIVNYTTWTRVLCFFAVIAGVGLVSIPAGLIASGFSEVIEESQSSDTKHESDTEYVLPDEKPTVLFDGFAQGVNDFLNAKQGAGKLFGHFVFVLILLNVVAVVVETVPDVGEWGQKNGEFFNVFEAFSVAVFTLEYIMRVFSVVKDPEHFYSRYFYCTTFFGVVDLIAILPWYIQVIWFPHDANMAVIFRIFRLFRVLQLEHFCEAFTLLDDVYRASANVLKATGLMALIIWLISGVLFYWFEKDNPNWTEGGVNPSFGDIPSALYFTAIFLAGEWAKTDFTVPGKLLCIVLVIAGIGIYSLPVGSLFDSFGEIIGGGGGDDDEEED